MSDRTMQITVLAASDEKLAMAKRCLTEIMPTGFSFSWQKVGDIGARGEQENVDGFVLFSSGNSETDVELLRRINNQVSRPLVYISEREDAELEAAVRDAGPVQHLVTSDLSQGLLRRVLHNTVGRWSDTLSNGSEELNFKSLVDNSLDIISLLDRTGKFRFVSPSSANVVGYSAQELLGKSAFGLIHPDDVQGVMSVFMKGFEIPGMVAGAEFRFRHKDGSWRMLEANAINLLEDPEVRGVIVNSRDITVRQEAERALFQSQELLKTVINRSPIMVFAVDQHGMFTLSEGRGVDTLVERTGDLPGRSVFEVFANDPTVLRDVHRALSGEAFRSEVSIPPATFECWYAPLSDESGRRSGAIGIATDVTALKGQEEQLKQSRAELRNLARYLQSIREQERTRIAREVHDVLGQAMTVLKMDAIWLSNKLGDVSTELRQKLSSMTELIASTIDTIRKIATELRPGILDDLGIGSAIEWQASEFQSRTGIDCKVHHRAEEIALDRGRSTSIFRIFQEILTNVARHASATRVDVSLTSQGGVLTLRVQDDGRGIREGDLTSSQSLGILGMRERALAWGGDVKIVGSDGKGTTVTVQMPTSLTEEREVLP